MFAAVFLLCLWFSIGFTLMGTGFCFR